MIARIRARGGTVHQTGASLAEADAHLRAHLLARDPAGVYVPPFDHPDIWAGNATCVAEAVAQLAALDAAAGQPERAGRPDAVVCS
ncbi:MAG: catabolic L-serine/threonine dehydratase, partial [Thelocarpon impressellum]